ncbi:hypothetical protein [Streptomyces sp. TLI_146]|uniref:hypothetical protein n=1 Tax=Streptomyces sp. TLI_146 TaxID=1938858 RepID=UPI000C7118C8|nr:hypothetical protein [Streptomyces sp. TLI_146]PKV83819.1 hypothetical protein BX283_1328 [Streptomyces sp. TLI_146]
MTTSQRHLGRIMAATALSALALVATGCSGGKGSDGGNDSASDAGKKADQALEHRKCLREQGLNVPEPKPGQDDRALSISGDGMTKEKMEKALKACAGKGGSGSGKGPTQADKDKMLKYAQCMRKNGFNMPDPKFDGGMMSAQRIPEGAEKVKFDKANKACESVSR